MPKHAAARAPKPLARLRAHKHTINRAPAPSWVSGWRDKIQTTKIINRLQTFGLDDPDNPTSPRLTRTQAQVLLSLLRKVLPDMQALEISGNSDQPITVQILRFSDPHEPTDGTNASAHVAHLDKPLTIDLQPDAFEAQIEANPRLIEDEPSPRRTRKKQPDQ
jgi:hypothetical protein